MNENRPANESETKRPTATESETNEPATKEPATKELALLAVLSAAILLIVVISATQSRKDRTRAFLSGGAPEISLPALHETPREVPAITFSDGEGRETGLDAFKGQVVGVNFRS